MNYKRKTVLMLLFVSFIATSMFVAIPNVHATTINVDNSWTTAQINSAISGAGSGDTVQFAAGTYNLDAPLVAGVAGVILQGDTSTPSNVIINAPTTAGLYDRDCFQVKANNVVIQGFKIVGAMDDRQGYHPSWGQDGRQNAGIMVGNDADHGETLMDDSNTYRGISGCTFRYNEIVDCSKGLYLYHAKNCEVSYNTIRTTEGKTPDNFYDILGWNGDAIMVYLETASDYPTGNTFSHNTMTNVRLGVMLNGDPIGGTDASAWDFRGTTIEDNTMTDVWNAGVIVQMASGTAGSPITIKDNTIDTSTGRRSGDECNERGLISVKGDYTVITGNTLRNSEEHGMWIDGSHHTITGNTVTSNTKDGIHVGPYKQVEPCQGWTLPNPISKTDININYNNIHGNTEDGLDGTAADEEVDAENNWWGDASGPGGVGPGTGDDVSSNVDYTPWLGEAYASTKSVGTATGTGTASFSPDSGALEGLTAVAEGTLPTAGKPNVVFPHGFFSFKVVGLTAGQTVTITVTLPSAVPVGTRWCKWHASVGWISLPIGSDDGDNVITITITDDGTGDFDPTDGEILDPGGPGNPSPVGGVWVPINKSKLLAPWIGLASLLIVSTVAVSVVYLKRRKKQQN